MKSTGIPDRLGNAFAENGEYNEIAQSSTTTSLADGVATYDVGFPPSTRTAIASGGKPPAGLDMNGVLFDITNKLKWADAGGTYPFDATFAASISGYPNGAVIPSSDYAGFWLNTSEGNATNPEGTASSTTGWLPLDFTGHVNLTMASTSLTMNCLDAAKTIIVIAGAMTANLYLYVPQWVKQWEIINNTTGGFNIIVSTTSSTATTSLSGGGITYQVYCDGTNTYKKIGAVAAYDTLPVSLGGTGKTTAADAIKNLGGLPIIGGTLTGDVTAPDIYSTGDITASSGTVTAKYIKSTGDVAAVDFVATGNIDGAALTVTGTASAATVKASGTVSGEYIVSTGEVVASGDIHGAALYAGNTVYQNDGNIDGTCWSGYLSTYISSIESNLQSQITTLSDDKVNDSEGGATGIGFSGSVVSAPYFAKSDGTYANLWCDQNAPAKLGALGLGTIGTYALLRNMDSTYIGEGDVVAGSTLEYASAGEYYSDSPSGSWRAMGRTNNKGGYDGDEVTLFLRIS